jgi:hypothetical protein
MLNEKEIRRITFASENKCKKSKRKGNKEFEEVKCVKILTHFGQC